MTFNQLILIHNYEAPWSFVLYHLDIEYSLKFLVAASAVVSQVILFTNENLNTLHNKY